MSELSKSLMKKLGIRQKLRLGKKLPKGGVESTGPHRVQFKADKEVTGKEYKLDDGSMKNEYIRYLFIENGEERVYNTKKYGKDGSLSYFIQHFVDIEPGDELIMEMKKTGAQNYVDISVVSTGKEVKVDEDDDDDDVPPEPGAEKVIDVQP